jgi:hypothetical protein
MIREGDGMQGVVTCGRDGVARVAYKDRGEWHVAQAREAWSEDIDPPGKLLESEKRAVAMAADQVLRSIVKHQPNRFWEEAPSEPFDAMLVRVIIDHLGTRT